MNILSHSIIVLLLLLLLSSQERVNIFNDVAGDGKEGPINNNNNNNNNNIFRQVQAYDVAEQERLIGWLGETHTVEREINTTKPWIETLSWEPRAFLYHNFLSSTEAEHLVNLGEPRVTRSTVVGGESGRVSDIRTSFGTFIPKRFDSVLRTIENRCAEFSGIPVEHQEQMQLLRYRDGQKYSDHTDGLISDNGGKRIATILMFLHEPTEGGETSFVMGKPLAKVKRRIEETKAEFSDCGYRGGKGFAVKPKVGDAILFFSFSESGITDNDSMHASCPTLGGTKWTATMWIHERPFDTATWREPECKNLHKECENWASRGECKANPIFMLGNEVVGTCSRSCCAVTDEKELSYTQSLFCDACKADSTFVKGSVA
jgi:prolyl 4-hydroxylase